jgi:uncharacterized protein (DUF1810 family)
LGSRGSTVLIGVVVGLGADPRRVTLFVTCCRNSYHNNVAAVDCRLHKGIASEAVGTTGDLFNLGRFVSVQVGVYERALAELRHPPLGPRLRQYAEAMLAVEGRTPSTIFSYPDDLKLHSSMTLFALAASPESVFARVLAKYFHGRQDARTILELERLRGK